MLQLNSNEPRRVELNFKFHLDVTRNDVTEKRDVDEQLESKIDRMTLLNIANVVFNFVIYMKIEWTKHEKIKRIAQNTGELSAP